jgi:hypothetical protein
MIPVLGVPIVNGLNWLERLVGSIDFKIGLLVVVNNNPEDEALKSGLDDLAAKGNEWIEKIKVVHLPGNIGVAASWNLIIKSNLNAPYWLISNHDVAFTEGLLEEFHARAGDEGIGMIHAGGGDFGDGSYDLFLLKDWTVQKLGLFDENFYPAYCEDADYIMRLKRHNRDNPTESIRTIGSLDRPYYHGERLSSEPNFYAEGGSQTSKSDPKLKEPLVEVNLKNFEYMNAKWGAGWRMTDPWERPMNLSGMPLSYTSFDLEFCRSKFIDLKEKEKKMQFFYNDSNPNEEHGIIDTNQFAASLTKKPRFFAVDDFYEDPMAVREFALSQTYFPGEGAVGHRTRKQFLFDGIKERFEEIIGCKIQDHTDDGYGWRDIGINGRFQYCPAGTNLVYHCDAQKWAATVYLTPDAPPSCGTSFFRHRETKIHHSSQINWETEGNKVFNQKTFLDGTPYEKVDTVGNIFNRLVIFDGGLIHSASEYFGWDLHSSRLFHIFFFN